MSYSIVILAFACFVLTVSGELSNDEHYKLRQKCVAEVELEADAIPLLGTPAFLEHPKAKCYYKCFLFNSKLIKEDGTVDIAASLGLIEPNLRENARPALTKCIEDHQADVDLCEKSFQIAKCLAEASPSTFAQLGLVQPPKKTE